MGKLLDLITPGEVLQEEFFNPLNINQTQLANNISVSPSKVKDIIDNKQPITANIALRLAKYFNISPEFWMNLQSHYDIEFNVEIVDASGTNTSQNKGTSYKRLLCVAFDLAVLITYSSKNFFHFVYHDGILEGLDNRKKLNF